MSVRLTRWDDAFEFWRLYGYLARTLALRRAVRWGTRLLAVGLFATLAAVVALRLLEQPLPALPLLFVPGLATAVLGLLVGYLYRDRPERAVRLADGRLELKERLTTALELVRSDTRHPLALAQVADAVQHFARADLMEAFPVRIPLRAGNLALLLALLLPLAALAPNPFAGAARPVERGREVAQQEALKLEQLAQDLAQQEQTSQLEMIRQLLQDASRALAADSTPPEQSLAALNDLEERLYRLGDADRQGLEVALAALAASLADTPGQQELARRLATGDLKQVSRDLRRLGQDQQGMSPAERALLAQALREAAQNAQRANPRFARGLQAAAEGLENAQGGAQAQQALSDLANQVASASAQERALAQAQQSRSNLSRALGQQSVSPSQAAQQQRGTAAGRTPRAGDRQEGVGGAPGESQAEGQGAGQPGQEGAGQSGDQPGGLSAGQGDSRAQDQIYDPLFTATRPEQVPGQDGSQLSEVSSDPYLSPAEQNPAQVGYREVFGQYQERAVQNIEQSYVPLGMKDLVRQYFNELDPSKSGG